LVGRYPIPALRLTLLTLFATLPASQVLPGGMAAGNAEPSADPHPRVPLPQPLHGNPYWSKLSFFQVANAMTAKQNFHPGKQIEQGWQILLVHRKTYQ
jgi:hypothetical protein